jgi:hypothetical protein
MSAETDEVEAAQRVGVGRVLVGVDGSERSRDALALGQALHASAGSVSRSLVRRASCPIVVFPRPGHDEAELEPTS